LIAPLSWSENVQRAAEGQTIAMYEWIKALPVIGGHIVDGWHAVFAAIVCLSLR